MRISDKHLDLDLRFNPPSRLNMVQYDFPMCLFETLFWSRNLAHHRCAEASTDKVKRGENFDLVFMRQSCVVMLSEVCGHGARADSRLGRPGESVLHATESGRPESQIVVW